MIDNTVTLVVITHNHMDAVCKKIKQVC